MPLVFTKMHGLGNDFVVIDGVNQSVTLTPGDLRHLGERRFGVGCDQVLLIEPADPGSDADFRYRIFNADGSEVEQCGNGVRCIARFLRDKGLTDRDEVRLDSAAGPIRPVIEADGRVRVDMGVPRLEPAEIPFDAPQRARLYPLKVDGRTLEISAVSLGNPHAVLTVPDVSEAPVAELGPRVQAQPRFPQGVNVGFMQVVSEDAIRLRVYERGVGETLACGTGACAAVVAGRLQGRLAERVGVDLPGGHLDVAWAGEGETLWMTGPAETVYEGCIEL